MEVGRLIDRGLGTLLAMATTPRHRPPWMRTVDSPSRCPDGPCMDPVDFTKVATLAAKAAMAALAYALPAILAAWWRQRRPERVARLNLLLGWTGIGWLALLLHVVGRRVRRTRSPGRRPKSRRPAAILHPSARRGNDLSAIRLGQRLTETAAR